MFSPRPDDDVARACPPPGASPARRGRPGRRCGTTAPGPRAPGRWRRDRRSPRTARGPGARSRRRRPGQAGRGLGVVHLELDIAEGAAVGVAGPLDAVSGARGRDRGCLGRSVGALDPASERLAGGVDEGRADRGSPRRHQPEASHPLPGEAGRSGHLGEEDRWCSHERHPFVLDAPQGLAGVPCRHEHGRDAGRGRDEHAVEQPRHVGQRRGHEHGVVGPEPVHGHHEGGLVAEAPVGVQRRLRHPGRPRGEQGHGDVGRPGRRRPDVDGGAGFELVEKSSVVSPPGRRAPDRCAPGMSGAARTSTGST